MNTTSTSTTTTGEQLRLARIRSGYSQDDLAAKVGVSQQSIAKWERGAASPRARRMAALTAAIGPLHSNTNTDQSNELRTPPASARPTSPILHELLAAEVIICTMLGVMTTDQKLAMAAKLDELGVAGEGATRFHERRAALVAAGAENLQPRPA
ncbi:helix-turn-helix domain-containing protein [Duganella phyllosphaerae]|uniref:Transcriptional repressor DicA n=1 Tax=Duganella phyllosphaerae TaxID=762836 RepID=A0A1E7W4I0_9BURK|nr:helix-turn-helix transcriptional regulator [Duganella phyllosphaerae]OEZ90699.1 transcriptional repressor DicA [Duganella phyllosphaerae]